MGEFAEMEALPALSPFPKRNSGGIRRRRRWRRRRTAEILLSSDGDEVLCLFDPHALALIMGYECIKSVRVVVVAGIRRGGERVSGDSEGHVFFVGHGGGDQERGWDRETWAATTTAEPSRQRVECSPDPGSSSETPTNLIISSNHEERVLRCCCCPRRGRGWLECVPSCMGSVAVAVAVVTAVYAEGNTGGEPALPDFS